MAKNFSAHQQKIIKNYYENLDSIMLERLQNIVGELYLNAGKAKQEKLWQRAKAAMENLKIPASLQKHILQTRNVELLAKNLNDWLKSA